MNITNKVTKMLESLLKLKVQMSLAKGDYDAVVLYADQLRSLQDGCANLPIQEDLENLLEYHDAWLVDQVSSDMFILELKKFYGDDLYSVCAAFFVEFGGAAFRELVTE